MTVSVRRSTPKDVQVSQRTFSLPLGEALPHVDDLADEILSYYHVLLGREPSPLISPYLTLAEVATAYYARALEIDSLIHELERKGDVVRNSQLYKFRTGALRSFIEAAKKCADLGSRRLTQEQLLADQRKTRSV